jgi:hypothetical protein
MHHPTPATLFPTYTRLNAQTPHAVTNEIDPRELKSNDHEKMQL